MAVVLRAVGINEYDEFRGLKHCVRDAQEICRIFQDRSSSIDVECFITSTSHNQNYASLENLKSMMYSLASMSLGDGDVLIFYFAGHGVRIQGEDFLVCADSQRIDEDILSTDSFIQFSDIVTNIKASGAGTIVTIVDACRQVLSRSIQEFGRSIQQAAQRQGMVAFLGCRPGQVCQELDELGHGVFTYALLQALGETNIRSAIEIDERVFQIVKRLVSEHMLQPQEPDTTVMPIRRGLIDIFTGNSVAIRDSVSKQALILVGPSTVGKTSLAEELKRDYNALHLEMSNYVWNRLNESGRDDLSVHEFISGLWNTDSKNVIASDVLKDVEASDVDRYIITGARAYEEVETLLQYNWDACCAYLFADMKTRYSRYRQLQPELHQLTYSEFAKKDLREFSWGLGRLGNLPGVHFIINDQEKDKSYNKIKGILANRRWPTPNFPN